jgi:hypothetical protein
MTLPHVLAYALKRRTGKPEARYVFGLGEWCIEDTRDRDSLIVHVEDHGWFRGLLRHSVPDLPNPGVQPAARGQ